VLITKLYESSVKSNGVAVCIYDNSGIVKYAYGFTNKGLVNIDFIININFLYIQMKFEMKLNYLKNHIF
jgi:hypothetical protein